MNIAKQLKELIVKKGGTPPANNNIAECLGCLCDCDSGSGGGIKTAIIKQDGYDNALAGIATTASEEIFSYTCLNMTYEEARQIMLAGEPLSILIMDYNNFGVHSHYATDVMLSAISPIIIFGDDVNSRDIYWGNKGVSTAQSDASDHWD